MGAHASCTCERHCLSSDDAEPGLYEQRAQRTIQGPRPALIGTGLAATLHWVAGNARAAGLTDMLRGHTFVRMALQRAVDGVCLRHCAHGRQA
jgi:hypothetical protein